MAALIAWIVVFGLAADRVAKRLDRSRPVWLVFGAILGPIALGLLRIAPPGRCRSCLTPTRGWLTVCAWCHEDVRVVPVRTRTLIAQLSHAQPGGERRLAREHARPNDHPRPANARQSKSTPPASSAPTSLPIPSSQPSGFGLPRVGGASRPTVGAPAITSQTADAIAVSPSRKPQSATIDNHVLATATFIAGSAALEPGRRYGFCVDAGRLQLLGPVDTDPSRVALGLDVRDTAASVIEGRLLVSQPALPSGSVLAFMLVAGMTTEALAAAIVDAAATARGT